jgi:hypothetical protein
VTSACSRSVSSGRGTTGTLASIVCWPRRTETITLSPGARR